MGEVIHLGIEKIKRYSYEDWADIIEKAKKETEGNKALLQKELLNSDIETINEYFEGAIMICGIFLDENKLPVYLWADGTEDPRTYSEEFEDIWYFSEVVDVEGNIDEF